MSAHLDDATLSRLLDSDVSLVAREAAFDHLRQCSACAARHDQLVATAALLRSLPPARWSPESSARIAAHLGQRRARGRIRPLALAAGLVAAAALCVAAVPALLAAPTLSLSLTLLSAVVPGRALAGVSGLVGVMVVVAVAAPLAAVPLARWR